MSLDIRIPIGLMFSIIGVILAVYGLVPNATMYEMHCGGTNMNLGWGCVLLAFGIFMLMMAYVACHRSKDGDKAVHAAARVVVSGMAANGTCGDSGDRLIRRIGWLLIVAGLATFVVTNVIVMVKEHQYEKMAISAPNLSGEDIARMPKLGQEVYFALETVKERARGECNTASVVRNYCIPIEACMVVAGIAFVGVARISRGRLRRLAKPVENGGDSP